MAKFNYETVASGAGFSGEQFDIAAGAADVDIIDVLLSAGNGILTSDAPLVLVSTGALFAGGVTLDISALELERPDCGTMALDGRFFFLSVQNSNIKTSNITVNSSATINGAATLVIKSATDYLFQHVTGGAWRCNVLPRPAENHATIARVPFAAVDWDAVTPNTISIPQATHGLLASGSYVVQVINTDMTPDEQVDCEIQFASNGDITLKKAAKGPDFAGVAIIVGSLE